MRILVTGAGGRLGRAFLDVVPSHHEVHPFGHDELDVGEHDRVMQAVASVGPHLVCNFAAIAKVDDCERDPATAFRVNAQGPQSLALASRACGATLLHISTDYVFDGEKQEPYDETDQPRPISVYGRSKLAAEDAVRIGLHEHVIVRTAAVFGGGSDHVTTQVARLRRGEEAAGVQDRICSPTYVRHLAERLLPLVLTGRFGTYHLAGPETLSWYELLVRCKQLGSLPGSVVPQRAAELGLPARRPERSALRSVFMENLSLPPMPPLDDALADLLGR